MPAETNEVAVPQHPEANVALISACAGALYDEVSKVIEGKGQHIRIALTVLFAGGHLLIEDVPGVGKTMLATSMGRALGVDQRRIQFTPDLLPSDITGVSILRPGSTEFEFRRGTIFTNLLLADEINRSSPKTQSALLEAMEESHVTVDSETHELPRPFMVMATSNPIEMEGTYALPEAQRDRFMARISLGYPDPTSEIKMLAVQSGRSNDFKAAHAALHTINTITSAGELASMMNQVRSIFISPELLEYTVHLANRTRQHPLLRLGVSPRATVHLVRAAKAYAAISGRDHVLPTDLQALLLPLWSHRVQLAPRAFASGQDSDQILRELSAQVPLAVGAR
ncbi:MoxR family ATPase [Micrococcales bacterium 31B]|nr:MoxR family ATPase [Micrococcales bacterium 31B]